MARHGKTIDIGSIGTTLEASAGSLSRWLANHSPTKHPTPTPPGRPGALGQHSGAVAFAKLGAKASEATSAESWRRKSRRSRIPAGAASPAGRIRTRRSLGGVPRTTPLTSAVRSAGGTCTTTSGLTSPRARLKRSSSGASGTRRQHTIATRQSAPRLPATTATTKQ